MDDPETRQADEVFDLDRLRKLVELMEEYDLAEVDLRQLEQRIRLRRGSEPIGSAPPPAVPPVAAAPVPAASENSPARPTVEPDSVTLIKSPMVGTFYGRPNPDAEAFVKVGDHIGPDTIVCIIEAMKVFNEIRAEVSGRVVAILVENEEAVEFGLPMFKVDTAG